MDSLAIVWSLMVSLLQLNVRVNKLEYALSPPSSAWDVTAGTISLADLNFDLPDTVSGAIMSDKIDSLSLQPEVEIVNPVGMEYNWKVNPDLKEFVPKRAIDDRPVCENVCPSDGGTMRLSDGHTLWICDKCGKQWYYK